MLNRPMLTKSALRSVCGVAASLLLAACGGGGDDPPPPVFVPTVSLSANPTSVTSGQTTTLTWSSTNATTCTASGGWSGARATSGTETSPALTANTTFTLSCTNGSQSGAASTTVTIGASGGNVVISGQVQFQRIPFKTLPAIGLDNNNPVTAPAREVVVEALEGATVLTATTTDANGMYSLTVPQNRTVAVRVKAQMLKTGAAPTWDFQIKNNTNSDALYALVGTAASSGTANSTRNLTAATGWNGTSYNQGQRSSGPFAILDTVYQAKQMLLGAQPALVLPALSLFWSETNKPAGPLCPRNGNINTSFYIGSGSGNDSCTAPLSPQPLSAGIYILGDFPSGDTDEFDQHVLAHEFGHYVEDRFSRSDSVGGSHGGGDRLDMRLAFGEGYGNAFGAMSLNNALYRDSAENPSRDGVRFSLETDTQANPGWFSETSVGRILWDVFDPAGEAGDTVALGFPPIFAVMQGAQRNTDAQTSIFSFISALRSENGTAASGIDALMSAEGIDGTGAFGVGETHNGGSAFFLPVYTTLPLNVTGPLVCVSGLNGSDNKHGRSKFLRLDLTATSNLVITLQGNAGSSVAATDPDLFLYRGGSLEAFGLGTTAGMEQVTRMGVAAGTYVLEVLDADTVSNSPTPRCMTVSVQAN